MLGCRRSPWLCPLNEQTRKLPAWKVGRGVEDIAEWEMGREVIWGSDSPRIG